MSGYEPEPVAMAGSIFSFSSVIRNQGPKDGSEHDYCKQAE